MRWFSFGCAAQEILVWPSRPYIHIKLQVWACVLFGRLVEDGAVTAMIMMPSNVGAHAQALPNTAGTCRHHFEIIPSTKYDEALPCFSCIQPCSIR